MPSWLEGFVTLLILTLSPRANATGTAWETVYEAEGMTVERRPLPGSDIVEIRASAKSPHSTKEIFETVWKYEDYPEFVPYSKRNVIVRNTGTEKIVYSQVAIPIIKDRDFTVRARYEHYPETGLYLIFGEGTDKEGPPESNDYVRIRRTRASWTIEPAEGGGSEVTYVVASEAGGFVPQWIQNRAQRDAARNFVIAMLNRVKQNLAKK